MKTLLHLRWLPFIATIPLLVGCAHFAAGPKAKVLADKGPIEIRFKPDLNHADVTEYHSESVTKAYADNQLLKKFLDKLDFTVETKTTNVDPDNGTATYMLVTTQKAGNADLTDYALPNLNENLDLTMTNTGKVLKAGDYPPGTLFFVPPTSLPENPVKVGDTWPMTAEWVSLKSGLPLKIQTVSTLEAIRQCGSIGKCAQIRINGSVALETAGTPLASPDDSSDHVLKMKFESGIQGSMLFSLDRGTVLYSYLKSTEGLKGERNRILIDSCMVTHVSDPKDENLVGSTPLTCSPDDELPRY